mmetsp:Transcript_47212/g.126321  ORF Transcript_47212/g.126321 Transcript_47212/m.126321 type:complete len:242 (-) Transcript_47212:49-774(-)|eukprot:CAMPEP_0171187702 /NCGR_PEP_ID=MMETSP0790-20130122/17456_1 /TAXON_ID=2925 /ORGANISM="Alexandrium catenella, Strain OF101" /LENGTH=241 /DNA_ID=CAMNT_0011652769 /DNA_START=41 /DNA_END=766 /DNA_ORIENTATION=-
MGLTFVTRWPLAALVLAVLSAAGTNEEGRKFLEENKDREGVITLKSGLQYKVLKAGTGKYHPKKDGSCECHYAGTTPALTPNAIDLPEADWKEFDSSYKRGSPTSFAPNQVIKGWTEAMQKMVEGDKWEMYIPSELGYGDSGSGDKIKGGDVLVFRMELLKILGGKKRAVMCNLKTKENCDDDEVKILDDWAGKTAEAVSAEVKRIEKYFEGTLKKGEREKLQPTFNMLKKIAKAKKKQEL